MSFIKYKQVFFCSDSTKILHYLKSLSECLLKISNDETLSDAIAELCKLKEKEGSSEDIIKAINETIASILIQYPKLTNDYDTVLETVLLSIVKDESSVNRHEYYKRYLRLLYKLEKYNELLSEAIKMHGIFNQDIYPLGIETLCQMAFNLNISLFNIVYYFRVDLQSICRVNHLWH